jgi:hypothetical protein
MLWLADQLGVEHRLLVKAAARCANTVRHLMRDERSTAAVDAALQYADGELSREDMQEYEDAAIDAFNAAKAAGAAASADSWSAYAAAKAAAAAAAAAGDAAAAGAGDAAARAANRRQTADICREELTEAVMQAAEKLWQQQAESRSVGDYPHA